MNIDDPAYGSHKWVEWRERIWLRKLKATTLCEVVGYQLANVLELPLQPWVTFYDEVAAKEKTPNNCVGILVERWPQYRYVTGLCGPAAEFPDLVARGLALGVFDRFEWPDWLVGDGEMRLVDLERIGIQLCWPPQRTSMRDYGKTTEHALEYSREHARTANVEAAFLQHLRALMVLNPRKIIDLSGHPSASLLEVTLVRGLEQRQWELRRVVDGIVRPKKSAQRRSRPNNTPRKSKLFDFIYDHPKKGELRGKIEVFPIPRGMWAVSWNIGTIDCDCELSDRWFTQERYTNKLGVLLTTAYEASNKRRFKCPSPSVRWGLVRGVSEELGSRLASGIDGLWNEVLDEWNDLHATTTRCWLTRPAPS